MPCYKEHKGSAACDAAYESLVLEKESQAANKSAAVLKDFESEEKEDENEEGYRILPDQLDRMVESKVATVTQVVKMTVSRIKKKKFNWSHFLGMAVNKV